MPFQLPSPIDPSESMRENQRQRLSLLQQPTFTQTVAPIIGNAVSNIATKGIEGYRDLQKQKSILLAQKGYSDYLSKLDSGNPITPQEHQIGRMFGMQLGLGPKEPPVKDDPYIVDPAILKQYGVTSPTRASALKMLGKPKTASLVSEESLKNAAQDFADGKITASELPQLLGRGNAELRFKFYDLVKKINPNYNMRDVDLAFKGASAYETKTSSDAANIRVNLNSAHSAFKSVMDRAAIVAGKMDQSSIQAFNSMIQSGKRQFNNTDAILLYTFLDQAAGNYARIVKRGSASIGEQDRQDALKVLSTKLNEGGIRAVQEAVDVEYHGALQGLPGGSSKKQDINPPPGYTLHRNKKTGETAYINDQNQIWQP